MRLKSRLLSMAAAGCLAALGLGVGPVTHAFAGTTTWCWDNDGNDVSLLNGQGGLWLGVETGAEQGYPGHAALCASQTPPGSTASELVGTGVFVNLDNAPYNGPYLADAGCGSDATAEVQPDCWTYANPTYTYAPAAAPAQGGTYTFTIPFSLCFGTNLTGGCSPSLNGPVNLGTTGIIVAEATTGAPAGTNQGAGLALTQGTVWIAGVAIPFAPSESASAGVGTQSVEAHPNNSTPICILNGYCPELPTGAAAAFTGTQDVYSISLNGINETYNPGYYCIVDSPGGSPC